MKPRRIIYPLYYLQFQRRTGDSQFLKLETLLDIKNEEKIEEIAGRLIDNGEFYGSKKLQLIFDEVKYFLENPNYDLTSLPIMENVKFNNQDLYEYLGKIYDLMNKNKKLLGLK